LAAALDRLFIQLSQSEELRGHPLRSLAQAYVAPSSGEARQFDDRQGYRDAPAAVCFGADIGRMVQIGVFVGYPDLTFRGRRPLTRGELAVTLNRLATVARIPDMASRREPFVDLPQGTWNAREAEAAARRGWMLGYPDGAFGWRRAVAREDLAVVLGRALKIRAPETGLNPTPPPAAPAVAANQRRLPDGSAITLVGVFYGERETRPWGKVPRGNALTVWTTRTGIPASGGVVTRAVVVDCNQREHKPAYDGGLYQGPPPPELKESWIVMPPPPLGRLLRLRIAFEEKEFRGAAVEFTIPYDEAWRSRQFESKTPDAWMAEAVDRAAADVMMALLDHQARVHVPGKHAFTPLMTAAYLGHTALARRLLDGGAALDSRNEMGATALFYAILHKRAEMVELLLARGADPNLRTVGRTPLEWASCPRIIQALKARGARGPGKRCGRGTDPLTWRPSGSSAVKRNPRCGL
jgi:hypothetical protein